MSAVHFACMGERFRRRYDSAELGQRGSRLCGIAFTLSERPGVLCRAGELACSPACTRFWCRRETSTSWSTTGLLTPSGCGGAACAAMGRAKQAARAAAETSLASRRVVICSSTPWHRIGRASEIRRMLSRNNDVLWPRAAARPRSCSRRGRSSSGARLRSRPLRSGDPAAGERDHLADDEVAPVGAEEQRELGALPALGHTL
jgi:hypothetical protein